MSEDEIVADLLDWAEQYDAFDRRAGTLKSLNHTSGGAMMLRQAAGEIARLRAGADIIRELVACFKPFCPADYKDGTQAIRVAEAFLSAKALYRTE